MEESKSEPKEFDQDMQYELTMSVNGEAPIKKRYLQRNSAEGGSTMEEYAGPAEAPTPAGTASKLFPPVQVPVGEFVTSEPPEYTPTQWNKFTSPDVLGAELANSVKRSQQRPKTYGVSCIGPSTDWKPYVWQTFDTQAEAADAAAIYYQFLCSIPFKVAKVWVSPTSGDVETETCIFKGAYYGALIENTTGSTTNTSAAPGGVTQQTATAPTTNLADFADKSAKRMQESLFQSQTGTITEIDV